MDRKIHARQQKLERLLATLNGKGSLLIAMQDNPDPDAIAAAAALRELANEKFDTKCTLAHGGIVGRAENRALVKYLALTLRQAEQMDPRRFDAVALVDTQPGTGNNSLPPDTIPDIVIDHHPIRPLTRKADFTDVRNHYGATSTIMHEHLSTAGIAIEAPLATALVYGIRSDTADLGREAGKADLDAYLALYPLANLRAIGRIQRRPVPRAYFEAVHRGLSSARAYGRCLVTSLGTTSNPDMISEIADLLLRDEESDWVLVYGFYDGNMLFSVRTADPDGHAGKAARRVAGREGGGGGHRTLAGGQVPLKRDSPQQRERLAKTVTRRFLGATCPSPSAGDLLVPESPREVVKK